MRADFGTARFVAGLIELLGWVAVVGGLIAVVLGFDERDGMPLIVGGVGVVVAGIFQVAGAQLIKAQVVTAENSGEMVALLREISKSGAGAGPTAAIEDGRAPPKPPARGRSLSDGAVAHGSDLIGTVVKRHKGRTIVREPEGFSIEGEGVYSTVIAAERAIDREV